MSYQPHPLRVQQRRVTGWRKPPGSRGCSRPSNYGNPFAVGDRHPRRFGTTINRGDAVELFRLAIQTPEAAWMTSAQRYRIRWILAHVAELRGLTLFCYCDLAAPCHADVLAELANR